MFRLCLLFFSFSVSIAVERIKFAAVIYRHGDRTPVSTYPTDPYRNESIWPARFGELTNTGKRQHYALGKSLRERYSHLLSDQFDPKELYVRSTDVDRTLMSAQANLAGLYPPTGKSVWNKDLMWQPIPIHTMPELDDEVLAMKKNCNTYNKEMEHFIHSKHYKERLSKYQSLMDYLTSYTGKKVKDYYDIENIYSNLFIENENNFTLPNWTKSVFPDKMREPSCYSFFTSAATPLLARLRAGPLLQDIMKKIKRVPLSHDPEHDYIKVAIYSGHDFTVATLLTALQMFDGNCPVFTATVFIELIYDTAASSHYIRISYRNSTQIVEPYVLSIPYCSKHCSVDRFTALYKNLLTVKFDNECGNQFPGILTASLFLGIVVLISIFVALKIQSRNNTQRGSHHVYTNVNSSGKVVFV